MKGENVVNRASWRRRAVAIVVAAAVCAAAAACGSEGAAESDAPAVEEAAGSQFQKIRPGDRVYTLDDLTSVGFKKGRTYGVEGLTGAVSAYYGFWGLDPYDRDDYEVRFYASHEDAVEHGTAFAEERIGHGAKLTKETATWTEGVKDARVCVNIGGTMSHGDSCLEPKYFDYVIAANMVLLCQGRDSLTSLEACDELLAEVGE